MLKLPSAKQNIDGKEEENDEYSYKDEVRPDRNEDN